MMHGGSLPLLTKAIVMGCFDSVGSRIICHCMLRPTTSKKHFASQVVESLCHESTWFQAFGSGLEVVHETRKFRPLQPWKSSPRIVPFVRCSKECNWSCNLEASRLAHSHNKASHIIWWDGWNCQTLRTKAIWESHASLIFSHLHFMLRFSGPSSNFGPFFGCWNGNLFSNQSFCDVLMSWTHFIDRIVNLSLKMERTFHFHTRFQHH